MSEATSRRVALLLEYDGTRLAGSQLQATARTVQGDLEAAIAKTTGESVRAAFAGRTDAGVHARGQVAAFTTTSALAPDTIASALNHWLAEDIAVLAAAEVDEAFDPRRHAVRRHYRYLVENRRSRPVLDRHFTWHVAGTLDAGAMDEAARSLTGEHDFAAFASALEDPAASTIRRLECFTAGRDSSRLVIDAVANAFLPHQVRRMTGALVAVGQGKLSPPAYRALLDGLPSSAGPAAPARGLALIRIEYAAEVFAQQQ
ncbi:MAG TPA: tRNA pseudouridine(38-40) synthase TruA [Dehalococcoidia bacterium]